MPSSRKQVAFDLDTKALEKYYPTDNWRNAYQDIRRDMLENEFVWQQGSVYTSTDLEANNTDKEMLFSVENGLLASIDEPPAIEAVMTEQEAEHEIEIDDDRHEGR